MTFWKNNKPKTPVTPNTIEQIKQSLTAPNPATPLPTPAAQEMPEFNMGEEPVPERLEPAKISVQAMPNNNYTPEESETMQGIEAELSQTMSEDDEIAQLESRKLELQKQKEEKIAQLRAAQVKDQIPVTGNLEAFMIETDKRIARLESLMFRMVSNGQQ